MAYGKPATNMGCGPVIVIPTVGLFVFIPLVFGVVKLVTWLLQ